MTGEYPVSMLVPTVSRGGNQEAGVEDMRPTKLQLAPFLNRHDTLYCCKMHSVSLVFGMMDMMEISGNIYKHLVQPDASCLVSTNHIPSLTEVGWL